MATVTIDILLIDDHPLVLDGLASVLSQEPDLHIVALARSLAEARAVLGTQLPDVGLVDIRLQDGSGLDLIAEAAARDARPAWIVLSSFETPQYVATALSLGAAGYLVKTAPSAHVAAAIRRAAAGQTVYSAKQLAEARRAGVLVLTAIDRGVVVGVMAGRSNDEIAGDLKVAPRTVEAHLSRLYERTGVATRTQLALRAEREGWLDLPEP